MVKRVQQKIAIIADEKRPAMSDAPHPMIDIRNVSKWYGAVQVLHDCSVQINKGDVVVGLRALGLGQVHADQDRQRLEPIQKGEIFVDGIQVNAKETNLPKLRSRVGMVFQNFELFPHLSVTENLTIAQVKVLGRSLDEAKTRGLKMLDRVGLMAHKDKFPGQLSGGQQQRGGDRPRAVDGPDRDAVRRAHLGARPRDGGRGART
jgi:glutamate/aspartate transport system ATP-binding protein